ncbi:hypothetical protein ACQEVB_05670 [Pseudonocardia sp. CA-107938]|uniref:hypothetical protein n=1 Tax=Pseudonocardia sp. CA-107938 TaxID=3240021 RepID=UPI003D8E6442
MNGFASKARRAAITAAIGLTLVTGTAGPAAAATDGFITVPQGAWKTLTECKQKGAEKFPGSGADSWFCQAQGSAYYLYFIYHT